MNWCKWRMRHLDLISSLLRETIEQLGTLGYNKGNETLLQAVLVLVAIVRSAETQALDWADNAREDERAFGSKIKTERTAAPESPGPHQTDGAVHERAGRPQEERACPRVGEPLHG